MRRVVGRIKIDDDVRRLLLSRSRKDINKEFIQGIDASDLRLANFKDDVPFFQRFLRFTARFFKLGDRVVFFLVGGNRKLNSSFSSSRRGMLKTIDCRATRQRDFLSWINSSDGFEERIIPQKLSVFKPLIGERRDAAVRIACENF